MATEDCHKCELFNHFLSDMLLELSGEDLSNASDPAAEMWSRLASESPFRVKGTKVCLGRFMDVIRRSREEMDHFTQRKFIFLHTCIELDMLHGAGFQKVALGQHKHQRGTDSSRETSEEAALRKACCNQMVLATMWMLDPDSLMLEHIILVSTEAWEQWHSRQNRKLRSCSEAESWLQGQLMGEWLQGVLDCFQAAMTEKSYAKCGFLLPRDGYEPANENCMIVRDDDMCRIMMHLVMGINFHRFNRCAPMLLGWSSRSCLFLKGGDVAQRELRNMLHDKACFERFKAEAHLYEGIGDIAKRSAMGHLATQQIYGVMEESGNEVSAESTAFLKSVHSRVLGSQIVEDAFNVQKNALPTAWQNRRGCVQAAYQNLLDKSPMQDKHRFAEVKPSTNPVARDMAIPADAFRVRLKSMPKQFYPITSVKQATDWPSCKAEDWGAAYAEQVLMQKACDQNELGLVRYSWLGGLFDPTHDLVVRKLVGNEPGPWFAPLGQIGSTVVVLWPMLEHELPPPAAPGSTYFVLDLSVDVVDVRRFFDCVWSLANWQSRRIVWRSPAWQANEFAKASHSALKPWCIRAFPQSGPETLLASASAQGFWNLKQPFIAKLARHEGVEANGDDLLSLGEAIAKKAVGGTDGEILDMMAKRLANPEGTPNTAIQDFLDIEGCVQYVSRDEAEDLQAVAKQAASREQRASSFKAAWVKRHAEVRPKAKAKPRARASGRGRNAAPPLALPQGELTQPMLAPLVPPGGAIWRGNQAGCWQSHLKPDFPRCSRSWHLWGHRRAAILVLRDLWQNYLLRHGQDISECPIQGLFGPDADADAALPPGSAAASSSG